GPAVQSELVVAALRRAGFVLAGRTNTPEFGPLPVTENLRYGVTRNPWDPDRTPGGSSGGAAAAVAAGMFPIAHGSDGGGSLRIPASCTGLVGLKASRGRVPSRFNQWEGALVEGALTRDVRDAAALLDAVCGPDPGSWYNAPAPQRPFAAEVGQDPGRLRIALQTEAPFGLSVHPFCVVAAERAADMLAGAGHVVTHARLDLLTQAALVGFVHLIDAGLAAYPGVDWSKAEPHIQAAHRRGLAVDSIRYAAAVQELESFSRELTNAWGRDFDVLLTPTMTIPPPRAGRVLQMAHADPDGAPPPVLAMTAFTMPASLAGLPAISLPTYVAPGGLPIGIMLVAGPWQEALLLRLAGQVEQLLPWGDRRPPQD
ncbi:MAG: amidase, partial [Mycobacteriales bacterium]